jgi:hypothetical protein
MTGAGHPADLGRGRAVAVGGAVVFLPHPPPLSLQWHPRPRKLPYIFKLLCKRIFSKLRKDVNQ